MISNNATVGRSAPPHRRLSRGAAVAAAGVMLLAGACRSSGNKDGSTATGDTTAEGGGGAPADAGPSTTSELWARNGTNDIVDDVIKVWSREVPNMKLNVTYLKGDEFAQKMGGADKPTLVIDTLAHLPELGKNRAVGTKDVNFGRDVLMIAVKKGNPKGITDPKVFGADPANVGMCAAGTVCGNTSAKVLEAAGITPAPDQTIEKESDLAKKVMAGELDAALMMRSDLTRVGQGELEGITITRPDDLDVVYRVMAVQRNATSERFLQFAEESKDLSDLLTRKGLRPVTAEGTVTTTKAPKEGKAEEPPK